MKLAVRIRRARDLAELSQTQLAAKVAVQRSAVSQWEHTVGTRPTVENLAKIAREALIYSALLPATDGGLAHHARKCLMQREQVRTCAGLATADQFPDGIDQPFPRICGVRFEWLGTGRGAMRLKESQQAPALVTSEFAHDDLEVRLLLAVRRFSARKREAIVEMIEKLGGG